MGNIISIEKLHSIFMACNQQIITDTRKIIAGGIFFALKGTNFNGNNFVKAALHAGAAYALADEHTDNDDSRILYCDNVLTMLQELAQYHRQQFQIPVLAITGSNGKTTTKELFNAVMQTTYNTLATEGNLNNHIGVPLTLLKITSQHQFAIIEMGANHQGEIGALCEIAMPTHGIITNVGKAHLDGFGGFEGVIKGKTEMYRHLQSRQQTIFVNAENPHLYPLINGYPKLITYLGPQSLVQANNNDNDMCLQVTWHTVHDSESHCIKSQLTGAYNFENIVASVEVGLHFDVSPHNICKAITNYEPANQRSQVVYKPGNITIILDAYNANPTSMSHAIKNFDKKFSGNKVALLGDMYELGADEYTEHGEIIALLKQCNISQLILVGPRFAQHSTTSHAIHFENIEDAATYLSQLSFANKNLLIKGSRSSHMDKAVNAIHD